MSEDFRESAPASPRRRREGIALMALLLAFAALTAFFANFHPTHGRFYDERFALQNVHSVLQHRAFVPANGYYLTLSYIPQTAVLGALEVLGQKIDGQSWIYLDTPPPANAKPPATGRAFTPLAYRVSRGIQVLWGLVTLAALFALGRRAFGAAAAWIGVAVLALSPWFLLSASKFKPDAALLATSVLALWLSARASERAFSWRAYALAGVAIAAAMSCKLTGGLTALPLTLVTCMQAFHERRRFAGLVAAGATSLVLFLVANPHLGLYLHFMQRLSSEYADKAKTYGGTHWGVARSSLEMVVSTEGFGLLFGSLALLGFVILGLRGWSRSSPLRRPAAAIVWLFGPIYLAAFAASTPHFKGNNVLSILPPLALLAGWLVAASWSRLSPWTARLPRPAARALAVGSVLAALSLPASATLIFVYESVVPTTQDAALRWLGSELGRRPTHLMSVEQAPESYRWEGHLLAPQRGLARFAWTQESLEDPSLVFDGVIGPPDRIELSPWAEQTGARFEPRLFKTRGPSMAARVRKWKRLGEPVQAFAESQDGHLRVRWPEDLETGWYSLEVWVPREALQDVGTSFRISGHQTPMAWRQAVGQGHLLTSTRFHFESEPPPSIELPDALTGHESIAFALYRWQPFS